MLLCSSAIDGALDGLIIVIIGVEIAASNETRDRADAEFPGIEAGVLDGNLLFVGGGAVSEVDGSATGEEGEVDAGMTMLLPVAEIKRWKRENRSGVDR
jgi:hypothetical protein